MDKVRVKYGLSMGKVWITVVVKKVLVLSPYYGHAAVHCCN